MTVTFAIGIKEVSTEQIFASPAPSRSEMAAFCNTFGLLVQSSVPILESIRVTAEQTAHPWLVAILAEVHSGLREGDNISGAATSSIKNLIALRIEALGELASQDPSLSWHPAESGQWVVPDFFGFFADFLAFVDAGEHCGDLDTALLRVRELNLADGVVDSYQKIWGRDVSLFFSILELLHSAGIPVLKCLKIIRETSPLRNEIDIVIESVENGSTLASALKSTDGQLSHPMLVAIVDAGESSGELEMALIRTRREMTSTSSP